MLAAACITNRSVSDVNESLSGINPLSSCLTSRAATLPALFTFGVMPTASELDLAAEIADSKLEMASMVPIENGKYDIYFAFCTRSGHCVEFFNNHITVTENWYSDAGFRSPYSCRSHQFRQAFQSIHADHNLSTARVIGYDCGLLLTYSGSELSIKVDHANSKPIFHTIFHTTQTYVYCIPISALH